MALAGGTVPGAAHETSGYKTSGRQMKIGKLRFRPTRRGWTILALCALALSSYTADAVASIDRVRAGVQTGSLVLGGLTRESADQRLRERANLLTSHPIDLFSQTRRMTVAPQQIGFKPDTVATLDDAMGVGRRGNFFVRVWHRIRSLFASTDVGWRSSYDRTTARAFVDGLAHEIDTEGQEAGIPAHG